MISAHAIELDPQNKMAYLGRGEVRERRADFKGALADFQKVLEIDPANTEALKEIEEVRDKMKAATPKDRKKTPGKTPIRIAKPQTSPHGPDGSTGSYALLWS